MFIDSAGVCGGSVKRCCTGGIALAVVACACSANLCSTANNGQCIKYRGPCLIFLTRWECAVWQACLILRQNKAERQALEDAMASGASVQDCVKAIESV